MRDAPWLTPLYISPEPYKRLGHALRANRLDQGLPLRIMAQRCCVSEAALGALELAKPGRRYRHLLGLVDQGHGWPPGTCVAILEGAAPPPPALPSSPGVRLAVGTGPLADRTDLVVAQLERIEAKVDWLACQVWQISTQIGHQRTVGVTPGQPPAQPVATWHLPATSGSTAKRLARVEIKIDMLFMMVTVLMPHLIVRSGPASFADGRPDTLVPPASAPKCSPGRPARSGAGPREAAERYAAQHELNLRIKAWARTQGMQPSRYGVAPRWMRQAWEQAQTAGEPADTS